ncbi:MAG: hypothetical protein LH660_12370 [Phormidesmis sp. CAN_BIN36]|nr:hypothetical protein [Phormidesmis sp. CAN_BIN36]
MVVDSVFRKGHAGGWLFLGVTTIAVLTATLTTTKLQDWANRATAHELQLSRLQTTTDRLDALEWRSITNQKIDSKLEADLKQQRHQSEIVLVELKATAASPESLQRTSSAYSTYVENVNQLLKLLAAGEIKDALEVDEAAVDPSYEKLHEIISEASAEATHTAKTTGNYAFLGIIFTNLSLIVAISLIFHQYRHASRRVQQALLEQESIRRSEQALKQDRDLLEAKVAERTQELEEKNTALIQVLFDFKQSQLQLIQSEKMSSLGQLVAGVAHEINNPVSFIYGNLTHAAQYTDDLLQLVDLYQKEYVHPAPEIKAHIDSIDLDFLKQDIHKVFDSMEMGASRIQAIVLSLRNFSRLDEAEFKIADVHEGIDNTLVILASLLKPVGSRPEIQIVKHYSKLPRIECYAGQLNQVFMNVLTNAIAALESKPTHPEESDMLTPTITIRTEMIDAIWLRITITDNGTGIPESIQSKLFEPFFTTKPVGKGTGLGMSISYQIMTQHQGKLYCNSVSGKGTDFFIEVPIQQIRVVDPD